MSSLLQAIVEHKQQERALLRSDGQRFAASFADKQTKVIAEVKLASPSFDLSDQVDVGELVRHYVTDDRIAALSILIDQHYFQGDISRALLAKPSGKPLLFKEFVLSTTQIDGAAYFGYDAVLLITRILTRQQLSSLMVYAQSKNIFPLVEVDTPEDLQQAFGLGKPGSYGIGYNCRNLATMAIDRSQHFGLYERFSHQFDRHLMFAFSGIQALEQVGEYIGQYNGVLIGTSLVREFIGQRGEIKDYR